MARNPAWVILAVWAAGLGAAAQFAKVAVLFDRMPATYPGASVTTLGLLVSVVGLTGLMFGTTAGLLVARAGYRPVLLTALAGAAILSAAQATLPPLPLMLALRVLEGISHLAIVVAGPVLIAQAAPLARQGLAMTLWSTFFGLTFAVLGLVGPPLADAHGIGALYLAHAAYMAGVALVLMALLPRDAAVKTAPLSPADLVRQHGAIYASAFVAAPAIGFVCYTMIYVAVLTLLPQLVGGAHQRLLATGMPLVSIAVSLTLGVWLLGRIPAVASVMAGFAATALAAAGLWLVWGQGVPVVAASLAMAASLGLVQGASFAAIPQLNPTADGRARAAGAVAQLGNLGTTSGTPLLAIIVARHGEAGLSVFVVGFATLGIALHLWLAARRRGG